MNAKRKAFGPTALTTVLTLCAVLGAACASSADVAKNPVICRLAYTAKVHYAPQILAFRQGWFAAKDVKIVDVKLGMSAGIAAAEALVSGSADVAVMGDVPGIISLASKRECVLVAAYGGGERMHSIVVAASSGIRKPEDLIGKRLGVQFGSSTHGAVYLYLKRHNIDPSRVTLVNMPQKDVIEALIGGSIDALAASDPTPSLAQTKAKGAWELACLSGLDNDYPLVIIATRSFADVHPEAVRAIVAGTRKGVAWIKKDANGAARELAKVTGAPVDLEINSLHKLEWVVKLDERTIKSLNATATFLHGIDRLK